MTLSVYTVMDHSFAIANNDVFNVRSDTLANVLPVLANDSSLSQSGVTLSVVGVGLPSGAGSVSVNAQGNALVYTPAENFVGTETFNYTISDGQGGSDTALVTVTTSGSAPKANPDSFTVAKGTIANLDVLANDTILPATGAALTITSVGFGKQRRFDRTEWNGAEQSSSVTRRIRRMPLRSQKHSPTKFLVVELFKRLEL